mmetsp:Transcript_45553/g.131976  ORF Transcript_45553/g.131976 Transcript_45553/m.131976 type:complete len:267 (+) Transcript_45553:1465-2265(+)
MYCTHLNHTVVMITSQEGARNVHGPEERCNEIHGFRERAIPAPQEVALLKAHNHQRYGHHVVADHDAAQKVPREADDGVGPDDEFLVAPVGHRHRLASAVVYGEQRRGWARSRHVTQDIPWRCLPLWPEVCHQQLRGFARLRRCQLTGEAALLIHVLLLHLWLHVLIRQWCSHFVLYLRYGEANGPGPQATDRRCLKTRETLAERGILLGEPPEGLLLMLMHSRELLDQVRKGRVVFLLRALSSRVHEGPTNAWGGVSASARRLPW